MGLRLGGGGKCMPRRSGQKGALYCHFRMFSPQKGRPMALHAPGEFGRQVRRWAFAGWSLLPSHSPMSAGFEHSGKAERLRPLALCARVRSRSLAHLKPGGTGLHLIGRTRLSPQYSCPFLLELSFKFQGRASSVVPKSGSFQPKYRRQSTLPFVPCSRRREPKSAWFIRKRPHRDQSTDPKTTTAGKQACGFLPFFSF